MAIVRTRWPSSPVNYGEPTGISRAALGSHPAAVQSLRAARVAPMLFAVTLGVGIVALVSGPFFSWTAIASLGVATIAFIIWRSRTVLTDPLSSPTESNSFDGAYGGPRRRPSWRPGRWPASSARPDWNAFDEIRAGWEQRHTSDLPDDPEAGHHAA